MDDEARKKEARKADGILIGIVLWVALFFAFGGFVSYFKPVWVTKTVSNIAITLFLGPFVLGMFFGPVIGSAWHASGLEEPPAMGCAEEFLFMWGLVAMGLVGWAWWRWEFSGWLMVPLTLFTLFVLGLGVNLLYDGLTLLFSWWRHRKRA